MVDAMVSNTIDFGCEGSSPSSCTKFEGKCRDAFPLFHWQKKMLEPAASQFEHLI